MCVNNLNDNLNSHKSHEVALTFPRSCSDDQWWRCFIKPWVFNFPVKSFRKCFSLEWTPRIDSLGRISSVIWYLLLILCYFITLCYTCSASLKTQHAASGAHAQCRKSSSYEKQQQSQQRGSQETAPARPTLLVWPSLTAAISARALFVHGAELMNLASQSGDAGGSQLLFANFNQDNT